MIILPWMALSGLHSFFVLIGDAPWAGAGANSAVVLMHQLAGDVRLCQINCLDLLCSVVDPKRKYALGGPVHPRQ